MSDEQTEQERDAAVIAAMQQHIAKKVYEDEPQGDMFLISTNMSNIIEYALAERRERMHLTAERDAARAENTRLRAACKEASDYLNSSSLREGSDEYASLNADDILRAALGIESEASE